MTIWDKILGIRKTPQREPRGGDAIEIANEWGIGDGTPLVVEASPNLERVFSDPNPTVPQRITARNREYWESASVKTKQADLAIAYLSHPNSEVVLRMLQHHIPTEVLNTFGVTDKLTDLLVYPNMEIRHEAAKVVWKCSDAALEGVFTILSSRGMTPSGIAPRDALGAAEILREHCPSERRQIFEQLALDALGSILYKVTPEYEQVMRRLARFLTSEHGNLVEVRCVSRDDPWRIELVFADGHEIVIGDHSGRVDITMMKFGYSGTGPSCFQAFLNEAGFDVTYEQVSRMEVGTILRPGNVR
jgi:hypothetical protein